MSSLNTLIKNCVQEDASGSLRLVIKNSGTTESAVAPFFMGDAWNDIQTTNTAGDNACRVVIKEP